MKLYCTCCAKIKADPRPELIRNADGHSLFYVCDHCLEPEDGPEDSEEDVDED